MTKNIILILAAFAVSVMPTLAAPLCTTGNLGSSSYGNAGFSCQIGDNIFSGFTFGAAGTGNTLTAAQVTVTPVVNANGIGFSFGVSNGGTNAFTAAGTGTSARSFTDTIQYSVNAPTSALPAWFSAARTDAVGGVVANGGTYTISKKLYSDAARTAPNTIDTVASVTQLSSQSQSNGISGAPVVTFYVKDQITVSSGGSTSAGATSKVVSFDNVFQTPEPGSVALLGGGLVGLGLLLKRHRKA